MLAGPHFVGRFIDNADSYFNSKKSSKLVIPDEFIDRSLLVLEVVDRGSGLEDVRKKYKFNRYSSINVGDVVIINRYNVLPLILENIDKDSNYYIGVMGDIIGVVPCG